MRNFLLTLVLFSGVNTCAQTCPELTPDKEKAGCIAQQSYQLSDFEPNRTYMVYHLFASATTQVTYQMYVGNDFEPAKATNWVRLHVHKGNLNMEVTHSDRELGTIQFDPKDGLPAGMLQVTLDNTKAAGDFQFSTVPADVQCQPRDICRPDGGKCVRAVSFTEPGLTGQVGDVCDYWVTRTTGQPDDVFLADCPANGCIGLAFTLPPGFTPDRGYTESGGAGLVKPFPTDAPWNVGLKSIDPRCQAK